jgi:sugar-specific transcriptional regulator TrmB
MNQKLLIQLLEDLNLTTLETKIYELLVVRGPTPAGEIARRIGSHRRNVYDAIDRMVNKGFLAYIKQNNLKYFQIQNPTKILDGLKQKQSDWEKIIPEIQENMKQWEDKKETLFFRGEAGIKQLFLEMAESKDEILIESTSKDPETIIKYFFSKYEKLKQENKIKSKMIFDKTTSKSVKDKIKELKNTKIKFVENFNNSVVSQYIFANNVATVLWLDEEPSVIVVRGSENADFHRTKFNLIWNKL